MSDPLDKSKPKNSTKDKTKQKKLKTQKISLSFEDEFDDGGPVFEIKKSSASRRLTKNKVKELKIENLNLEETERISEVKYDEDTLSFLRKQQNAQNGRPVSEFDVSSEFNTSIPNGDAIFLAKKKREMLRQGIIDPEDEETKDFIPLNSNLKDIGYGSRLVREDDEIGDGEDELNVHMGERFTLKKGDLKDQLHQKAIDEMKDTLNDFDNDGDSDPEYEAIERERLRQAIGNHKISATLNSNPNFNTCPLPKVSPLPTFPQIQNTLKIEVLQYKERIKPYQSALETKNMNVLILDEKLKEMSLQQELLDSRILKYESMPTTHPRINNQNSDLSSKAQM